MNESCAARLGALAALSSFIFAGTAAATPDEDSDSVAEVVVTANKRSQSIQDVGVTANVLGAAQLAERKISTLADIAAAVPGLSYSASENNTPVFTLRGVGFNEAALATYPTVSVYVDEAPLAFPVLSAQGAFDLQRIEVLKGPQGTLFGENSTGGAINYIAAKPTDRFSTGEEISYGRFNTVEFNGFASGPLSDTLKGRVAVHVVHGDDWQQSYTRNDTLGKTESYAGRGMLTWTPLDSLHFNLTLSGWRDKSDPEAGQLVTIEQQVAAGAKSGVTNYPYPSYNSRTADWSNSGPSPDGSTVPFRPFSDRSMYQAMLRSDVDLTDRITMTSLTSYARFEQTQAVDYDGIALNDDDIPRNDGSIRSFYQELRVANGSQAGLRWIGGGNYQESRINENDSITYLDGSTSFPGLNNMYENGYFSNTYRRDYAVFGNIEYDLTSRLTAIGGARYTSNLTRTDICNADLGDGRISALVTGLSSLLTGHAVPPLTPDQCISLTLQNLPGPHYLGRLDQNNVSWRFGLNYKPVDDVLIYASASRGYKAGSFPTISASSFRQYTPVTQESVTAFESGIKTSLLDRKLTLDAAVYYYDYNNKQIRGKVLDPVFGVLNALVNVPKSHLYGAEAEARVRPLRGLELGATVTYVQSSVDRYEGTSVIGQTVNFAGSRIPFAPAWQTQLDFQYRWSLGSVSPFIGGDVGSRSAATTYIGGESISVPNTATSSTAPGVTNPFEISAYTLVNLRGGVSWDDGKWQAMLWGKNVFNRYYWQNVIFAFDTGYRLPGRPATYGVSFSYNY